MHNCELEKFVKIDRSCSPKILGQSPGPQSKDLAEGPQTLQRAASGHKNFWRKL